MPNYHFESLSPDDFQRFVQALIIGVYPSTQCFPVGQKDGGRDAWSETPPEGMGRILFQAKSSRNPQRKDAPDKIILAVEKDIDNLDKELLKSADRYIVATNVQGTAALNSGSIDRMNAMLTEKLDIPFEC